MISCHEPVAETSWVLPVFFFLAGFIFAEQTLCVISLLNCETCAIFIFIILVGRCSCLNYYAHFLRFICPVCATFCTLCIYASFLIIHHVDIFIINISDVTRQSILPMKWKVINKNGWYLLQVQKVQKEYEKLYKQHQRYRRDLQRKKTQVLEEKKESMEELSSMKEKLAVRWCFVTYPLFLSCKHELIIKNCSVF